MTQQPDFSKGLIPAILQDVQTKQVLMLGYMNENAYNKTLAEGRFVFIHVLKTAYGPKEKLLVTPKSFKMYT